MSVIYYPDGTIKTSAEEPIGFRAFATGNTKPETLWVHPRKAQVIGPVGSRRYRYYGTGQIERPDSNGVVTDGRRHFSANGDRWQLRNEADTCFIDNHFFHMEGLPALPEPVMVEVEAAELTRLRLQNQILRKKLAQLEKSVQATQGSIRINPHQNIQLQGKGEDQTADIQLYAADHSDSFRMG